MASKVALTSYVIHAAQSIAVAKTQDAGSKMNANTHSAIKNGQRLKAIANRFGVDSTPGE